MATGESMTAQVPITVGTSASLPASPARTRRAIVATTIGNILEWFELSVYGFLASIIAPVFFPTSSQRLSITITLLTFGVTYLARPVGAVVLGAISDRAGRKQSLTLSIVLMMVGSSLIAFVPSYASIGILAPVLVLAGRLVQGFSAGGEFGSATAYLVEHDQRRRGFMGSWQFATQGISIVLAAGCAVALTTLLTPGQAQDWGWRIPFVLGILIGPVGFYIRRTMTESPEFTSARDDNQLETTNTTVVILRHHKLALATAVGAVAMSTSVNYLITYMPTFAISELGLPKATSFLAAAFAGVVLFCVCPLSGRLSDRLGQAPVMVVTTIVTAIVIIPVFLVVTSWPTALTFGAVVMVMALLKASYAGPLPAFLALCFPVSTRATGLALSYNLGVTLFGGFAPAISSLLIAWTGVKAAPAFYIVALALMTLLIMGTSGRRVTQR